MTKSFEIKKTLPNNKLFETLTRSISPTNFPEIHDAEFFITKDGLIVNAEGWYHPSDKLICEVIYYPDPNGLKKIFGNRYSKATLYPGTYNPIPYNKRSSLLTKINPSLNQKKVNPYFAKYKQIIPKTDLVSYVDSKNAFRTIISNDKQSQFLLKDIRDFERLLGIKVDLNDLGLTGAMSLGNTKGYHDFDLVFYSDLQKNMAIAKKIRDFVKENKKNRIIEGGKGWNIRFYNSRNTLMCCFFAYKNPNQAPLLDFTMKIIDPDVKITGTICDDTHTLYTPSVLKLTDVKVKKGKNNSFDDLTLIIYHTASRGECFEGDEITAEGALVEITTPSSVYNALCVIEREGVRNLTPSWKDFYLD